MATVSGQSRRRRCRRAIPLPLLGTLRTRREVLSHLLQHPSVPTCCVFDSGLLLWLLPRPSAYHSDLSGVRLLHYPVRVYWHLPAVLPSSQKVPWALLGKTVDVVEDQKAVEEGKSLLGDL